MAIDQDKIFDRRIVDRNIAKGLTSKTDYEAHLSGLADVEENAIPVLTDEDEAGSEGAEGAPEVPETPEPVEG